MLRIPCWTTWLYIPLIALFAYIINETSGLGNSNTLQSFTRNFNQVFSAILVGRRMGTQAEWRKALGELPSTPDRIPSFFFAHGSPMLAFPEDEYNDPMMAYQGPNGSLATFLKDFGSALLKKYDPKGIVVFSAHWETSGERLGEIAGH